jgi:hypothetical protein
MCEENPHVVFLPLAIVGIEASSIGIEYLQEHLIGEMIDRPGRRPLCVLTGGFKGGLTCGKSVGESRRVNRLTYCCSTVAFMVLDENKDENKDMTLRETSEVRGDVFGELPRMGLSRNNNVQHLVDSSK